MSSFFESLIIVAAISSNLQYVPLHTQYVHPHVLIQRDSGLFPPSVLSSRPSLVSALHFPEITCQSKHAFSVYSWSLIVYTAFTSRDIEPLKLNISKPQSNLTDQVRAGFPPLNKMTIRSDKCCGPPDPPSSSSSSCVDWFDTVKYSSICALC